MRKGPNRTAKEPLLGCEMASFANPFGPFRKAAKPVLRRYTANPLVPNGFCQTAENARFSRRNDRSLETTPVFSGCSAAFLTFAERPRGCLSMFFLYSRIPLGCPERDLPATPSFVKISQNAASEKAFSKNLYIFVGAKMSDKTVVEN